MLPKAVGGSSMTVAEATVIADNALEHTVRTILASLQAPEILKSTSGNAYNVLSIQFNTALPSLPAFELLKSNSGHACNTLSTQCKPIRPHGNLHRFSNP